MVWRNDAGLEGRSVVVTGASGGIGRKLVAAVADAGAQVLAVDVPGSAVGEIVAGLSGEPHRALEVDLLELAEHERIMTAAQQLAPLAAVVNVAAVIRRRETIDDVTEEDWDLQHDVNLKAAFFLNRAAHHAFRAQGTGGSIVNFTSQGWWTGGFGGSVVYSASKGGVVSMTRGLARSFAPDGVRVNAISPGAVDTSMFRDGVTDEGVASFISMIPLGRVGQPEEIAGPVLFLASEASAYITGAVINVSGGQLMY